ncbi:TPA: hypothetical protein DIC38_02060 [Candidatus Nomurabacteria bacterium]|nr:hypothetical protein [Candidatus Nomurabacteria bacterium]
MKNFLQIIKYIILTLFIILLIYIILNRFDIALMFDIPAVLITIISLVFFIYLWFYFLKTYFKIKKVENEFIGIVNHTFRTPLTNISWTIKELGKAMTENDRSIYIQNINNSISKLLEIVDIIAGIQNIRNRSSYNFKAISIREIIEKSIIKYRRGINKKNLSLKVSPFREIPMLTIDTKKISFVIDTLIENAILYSKEEGKIIIDCVYDNEKIILFVNDNGIGLRPINKFMLFSKFYRGKRAKLMNTDGMGLKLYLSKEIIKRHKGKIYAKSKGKDMGSTFFIEIPFAK